MDKKYVVVNGAVCKCKFSEDPNAVDTLIVKSQKKHFANDKQANKKLIATTKDVNQTLKNGTFGNCTLQKSSNGNGPCIAIIVKWSNPYEKVTLSNGGKILTEISKAECSTGGPDSIEIFRHGQVAELSKRHLRNANRSILKQINPLVNIDELDDDSICF